MNSDLPIRAEQLYEPGIPGQARGGLANSPHHGSDLPIRAEQLYEPSDKLGDKLGPVFLELNDCFEQSTELIFCCTRGYVADIVVVDFADGYGIFKPVQFPIIPPEFKRGFRF